jgi:ribosome recycling factor
MLRNTFCTRSLVVPTSLQQNSKVMMIRSLFSQISKRNKFLFATGFTTQPLLFSSLRLSHGFGGSEKGKPRISYEERMAKRIPKTREQKKEAEARLLEAEKYVDTELPDICTLEKEKILKKAEHSVQRLLHPIQALFDVPVEVNGQQKPLSQLATIVKVDARDYDIVPNSNAFTSPILLRISRYDSALNAHKTGEKIRVTVPQMTRSKRVAVAEHVKDLGTKTKKHFQLVRRHAINHIEDLKINDNTADVRKQECEEIIKTCEAELEEKLEELAQSVLMQTDEDDDVEGGNV